MRESLLSLPLLFAIAAGELAAGSVQKGMHLSRDGTGQVLIYPYYTVNSHHPANTTNQSLVSIVNSSERSKAVRLFFHEGRNGRIVVEITLYLSAFDTWTGAIFSINSTGPANLVTLDRSCTDPALRESTTLPQVGSNGYRYMPFSNASYTGPRNDSGPDDLARTREGYITLIELGEVTPGGSGTLAAITNNSSGAPGSCDPLLAAWALNGYWMLNRMADLAPPGGGLAGNVQLIDVTNGTMQLIQADAIENFSDLILNYPPGDEQPNLSYVNAGGPNDPIAVDVILEGVPTRLSYWPVPNPIQAVSALFMAEAIHNEFVTSASLGGASEWVVNFPTKPYYVQGSGTDPQPTPPFTHAFPVTGDLGKAPVAFGIEAWTRDGVVLNCIPPYTYEGCIVGTPPPSQASELNYVTNVVSFNQQELGLSRSLILGAEQSVPIDFFDIFDGGTLPEGSMTMRFADAQAGIGPRLFPDLNGRDLYGMPVQGFWVTSYTNTAVTPGILANYSDTIRHFVQQAATPVTTGSVAREED